ncbi:MAG TPA: hypothetical protein VGS07_20395 [Thermoanaerobaculia bacterium]|jgi:hypothetical protein|nr:hypothetical protein [Thermoanaerobaculia bacterium]
MSRSFAGLQWLANSAGITGILIAIGYFVHSSQESFLGVSVNLENPAVTFLLDGGRFLADILVLIPSAIFSDYNTLLPLATVVIAGAIVLWQRRRRRLHIPALLYLLIALLASGAELVFHDLPVLNVSDLLLVTVVKPNDPIPTEVPFILRSRTEKLWHVIVCSRTSCQGKYEDAEKFERAWFTSSLLYTITIIIVAIPLVSRLWERRREDLSFGAQFSSRAIAIVVLCLVGLNVLFLPIIYARLIRPTTFPEVLLWAKNLPPVEALPRINPADSMNQPAAARIDGFLLSYGDVLAVYDKDDKKVWLVPKASLLAVRIATTSDILESRFSDSEDE